MATLHKYQLKIQGQQVKVITDMSAGELTAAIKKHEGYEVTVIEPTPWVFNDRVKIAFAGPLDNNFYIQA